MSMFTASVGPLLAGHRPVGGERREQLGPPGVQGPGEAQEFRDLGVGAVVQDLPEPVLGVPQVAAAPVEQHQFLGDDPRLGQLPRWVAQHQGGLELGPLPLFSVVNDRRSNLRPR